jgi:hypothetical protein
MSQRTSAYSPRRTRLYHNCKLLAPDGQLLSTIDKRKLEWYLQKGLGGNYGNMHGYKAQYSCDFQHTTVYNINIKILILLKP